LLLSRVFFTKKEIEGSILAGNTTYGRFRTIPYLGVPVSRD